MSELVKRRLQRRGLRRNDLQRDGEVKMNRVQGTNVKALEVEDGVVDRGTWGSKASDEKEYLACGRETYIDNGRMTEEIQRSGGA